MWVTALRIYAFFADSRQDLRTPHFLLWVVKTHNKLDYPDEESSLVLPRWLSWRSWNLTSALSPPKLDVAIPLLKTVQSMLFSRCWNFSIAFALACNWNSSALRFDFSNRNCVPKCLVSLWTDFNWRKMRLTDYRFQFSTSKLLDHINCWNVKRMNWILGFSLNVNDDWINI